MATHSSILAWRIPWTEEPGVLRFMGSQGVGHDTLLLVHFPSKIFLDYLKGLYLSYGLALPQPLPPITCSIPTASLLSPHFQLLVPGLV